MRILDLAPRDGTIPLLQILGPEPGGRYPEQRDQLITAVRLSHRPRFSFRGVRRLGDQCLTSCLGPTLFFAANCGKPVGAIDLGPSLAADLHAGLLEIGALLLDLDHHRALGANEQLSAAHCELHAGADTAPALASALGVSTLVATGHLHLLEHWGVGPAESSEVAAEGFAIAA